MTNYPVDMEIDLRPRTSHRYIISAAHRRSQPHKSYWLISPVEEVECFVISMSSNWIEENMTAWGLYKNGSSLRELGQNSFNEPLKLAKFIDKNESDIWHGYPADYIRNNKDRPGMKLMLKWVENNFILKHQMMKIRQGKVCNL